MKNTGTKSFLVTRKEVMSKNKQIRPCDCPDMDTARRLEGGQGVSWNENSIHIEPLKVVLKLGHTTVTMPMSLFKKMAEWYLTPVELMDYKEVDHDRV